MKFCFSYATSVLLLVFVELLNANAAFSSPQSVQDGNAPVVRKVEPPNWWVGLTPDLMVLVSGHGLQATKVACNLPDVTVGRTQATQGGDYLFAVQERGIGPEHIRAELGELLIGEREGRRAADELTVFKSLGIAVEDLAAAELVYARARAEGAGTAVPW